MTESPIILEWIEKGRQEGQLNTYRQGIRIAWEVRFGSPVPPNVQSRIDAESDPTRLAHVLRAVALVENIEAFRAAVTPRDGKAHPPRPFSSRFM